MRTLAFVVAAFILSNLASPPAPARAQGGPFGLGLIVGSPTGVSAKLYFNRSNALDFALGGAFLNNRGLHFHMDYLWHPVMLASDEAFFMPLYFGVGGRILSHQFGRDEDDLHLGVRVPVGILFDFKRIPIDVFVELALIVDFVEDHGDHVDFNASAGVRYYF